MDGGRYGYTGADGPVMAVGTKVVGTLATVNIGENGTDGTGGGGGGGTWTGSAANTGGDGGDGIIIVRYNLTTLT